jgi:hypothetical protein
MLHVKSDLNVLIRLYISRFDYRRIGLDLQRLGAAWSGQEVSLGFALVASAAHLQRTLAGRARLQLLFCTAKMYEFIHDNCKIYMNSYMI